jgi:LmbE family N-acetylglucosaminyl deacetylase
MSDLRPAVASVDPDEVFGGVVLITVPHMDDEALACGGTIARLSGRHRIHLVYATDGTQAPEPVLPWLDAVSPDLGAIRRRESIAAMARLGVPESNLHFLDLPERRLERHQTRLDACIAAAVRRIQPDHILTPFRYDRHRDHIALNRAATGALGERPGVMLTEYFVYHHWRLLPKRDVRQYIRPGEMFQVNIAGATAAKRAALECFTSQTTRFYPWQARPNLTPALLDAVSREPELFLRYRPSLPDASVLEGPVTWIRVAHRLESPLKRLKDQAVALARRPFALQNRGQRSGSS